MMRPATRWAALATLVLAGCAATPPERLHTLVAAADPAVAAMAPPLSLRLQVAGVPAQVDQPQWLVRLPDDSLLLLDQERWAAPLRDELRAGLMQSLVARFGVVDAASARSAPTAWRVVVDVTRFESLPGREARLDASWALTPGDASAPALTCRSALREAVGAGAPALAEGHRRAVVALAGQIGSALRAGGTAACPG